MMKLLGSVCVFLGFGYGWSLHRAQRSRERTARAELAAALRHIQQEICSRQTPIPRLAEELAANTHGDVKALFSAFLQQIQSEIPLANAWDYAMEEFPLPLPEKVLAVKLGASLSKEESIIVKELSFTIKELETKRQLTEKARAETEKRASALWFSAAALLVILLI